MKASQLGLCSIWLSGLLLIALSLYATHRLPSLKDHIKNPKFSYKGFSTPNVTLFTAPNPFTGYAGAWQALTIKSWLALSPKITVVMFSQDPSVVAFAGPFGSRVLVDSKIDFTFLGTPFFHSIVARSRKYTSGISVLVDPLTNLLPDFMDALSYAHKLDGNWLLVSSPRNISNFLYRMDEAWVKDGKFIRAQQLQKTLGQNPHWNYCDGRILMAWNNGHLPLHAGVLPPFLYGRGVHNQWVLNEALISGFRFVFDASQAISSFHLPEILYNLSVGGSSVSNAENRSWEYNGNSHLGTLYGSMLYHESNYSSLIKLLKCDGQYLLVDTHQNVVYPSGYQGVRGIWKGTILHSWRWHKKMACLDDIKSLERISDCSIKDQLKLSEPFDVPVSLESLLPLVANSNKTVVLSIAGYSYKDMLMSWVCRLRSLLITNFLVCALDDETYQFSVLQGLPVVKDPSAPTGISFDDCHFGTKCFQRVTKAKSRIVLKILKLGYNVLLSDVDVYWFRNPLPLLETFGPSILVAQSDEYNKTGPINLPRRLNSGFYFAHSDDATITAMEKVVKHAAASGLSEQPSFYDVLCGEGGSNRVGGDRCVEPETNLTVHFLDRNLFPNGAYEDMWQRKKLKVNCAKRGCLVLHNNWISGRRKKLERQVMSGLWDYDTSTRMCLQSWHRTKKNS